MSEPVVDKADSRFASRRREMGKERERDKDRDRRDRKETAAPSTSIATSKEDQTKEITVRGHKGVVQCLSWNADYSNLASCSSDHSIRIWSPSQLSSSNAGGGSAELKGHSAGVERVAWSPSDVNILASLCAGEKVTRVWDARSRQAVHNFESSSFTPINLAWQPQGNQLVLGGKDDTVRLLDIRNGGAEVCKRKWNGEEVNQMAWSPDGGLLCLAMGSGAIQVVNESLEDVTRLACHTASAYCINWPAESDCFSVGAADALASVWRYQPSRSMDESIGEFYCELTMGRLDWPVRTLSLSKNGSMLAAGSASDPFIDISASQASKKIAVRGPVSWVAFGPDSLLAYATEETESRSVRPTGCFHLVPVTL